MNYNERELIDAVLLDFSKALDKVPHQCASPWNYITMVKCFSRSRASPGVSRSLLKVILLQLHPSQVPQGTVLDPLLFLNYINDFPQMLRNCPHPDCSPTIASYTRRSTQCRIPLPSMRTWTGYIIGRKTDSCPPTLQSARSSESHGSAIPSMSSAQSVAATYS